MTCIAYNNCNHKDCDKSFCIRKYKLDMLYSKSQLSDKHMAHKVLYIDEDGTDESAFKKLKSISKNIESFVKDGYNLYLHSSICGNGKTSWSVRLLQSYLNSIWAKADTSCHGLFIDVPDFIRGIKDNITVRDESVAIIKQYIYEADLVVWDDIASKNATEFELSYLFSFIDRRIALGKSNIYTTNCAREDIYKYLGQRLGSRICNYSVGIELNGLDKRGSSTQLMLPDYLK